MAATKIAASVGVSAGRNGRSAYFGNDCAIASKHSEQFQDQQDRGNDHRPFDEDVIAPVPWERRVGFCHYAISPVVTRFPSGPLAAFSTTPPSASSSRVPSGSLQ